MIKVEKRDNESFESMFRRFSRKVHQSGVVKRARKDRFYEPEKSDNMKKRKAVRRAQKSEEREEMKRLGLFPYDRRRR